MQSTVEPRVSTAVFKTWPEGTNTNLLSGPSWAGYTARQDNAPVAATTTYDIYDESRDFNNLPGELIAARAAYQVARAERRRIEDRFRHLRTPGNEALFAIQSAHQAFKEAAQRYEAALIAFLGFVGHATDSAVCLVVQTPAA